MANEMPSPDAFTGLTRTVIAYSAAFTRIIEKAKAGALTDADWADMEKLVDVPAFVREGVFGGEQAETFGWPTYRSTITQYGGQAEWEGTLRNVTETPGRVILELEERSTQNGVTSVANTVTIYEFNDAGQVRHLDVYVMPKGTR
jgi:hypothetical protein